MAFDPNPPMNAAHFDEHWAYFGVEDDDAFIAKALDCHARTIRRWRVTGDIPGPVRALLRAQRILFNAGLPLEFSNGFKIIPLTIPMLKTGS